MMISFVRGRRAHFAALMALVAASSAMSGCGSTPAVESVEIGGKDKVKPGEFKPPGDIAAKGPKAAKSAVPIRSIKERPGG